MRVYSLVKSDLPMQSTNTILMVKPLFFRLNEQTVVNNYYQAHKTYDFSTIEQAAIMEFEGAVTKLKDNGIHVLVLEDRPDVVTPDSVFPNNWFSTDQEGNLIFYPMFAPNRRLERRSDLVDTLSDHGFLVKSFTDLSSHENKGRFLEGTGSLVLDRTHKKAYACISERTSRELVMEWSRIFDYEAVVFEGYQTIDGRRLPVYHTNVIMSIGSDWALICLGAIDEASVQSHVLQSLADGRQVKIISEDEMNAFGGNILEVENATGERLIVLSQTAFDHMEKSTQDFLRNHGKLVILNIPTIEEYGGGSARCMMAEVFLPKS